MLVNFDVEQYVYLLEHNLMVVYDNWIDAMLVWKQLMYADYVHEDDHLNVDDFFYYQD